MGFAAQKRGELCTDGPSRWGGVGWDTEVEELACVTHTDGAPVIAEEGSDEQRHNSMNQQVQKFRSWLKSIRDTRSKIWSMEFMSGRRPERLRESHTGHTEVQLEKSDPPTRGAYRSWTVKSVWRLCFILTGCHHHGAQHTCISRRCSPVQGSGWPLHVWTLRRWAVLEDRRKGEFCSLFALLRKCIIKLLLKNRYFAIYFNFKLYILCTRLKFHF